MTSDPLVARLRRRPVRPDPSPSPTGCAGRGRPRAWSTWRGRPPTRRSARSRWPPPTPGSSASRSTATTSSLEELAAEVSPRVLEAPARLDAVRRQLDEYFAGARQRVRPAHRPVAVVGLLPPGARGAVRGAVRPDRPLHRPRPQRRAAPAPPGRWARPCARTRSRSSSPATGCSPPTARSATTPAASSASRPSSPSKAPSSSEAGRYARPSGPRSPTGRGSGFKYRQVWVRIPPSERACGFDPAPGIRRRALVHDAWVVRAARDPDRPTPRRMPCDVAVAEVHGQST